VSQFTAAINKEEDADSDKVANLKQNLQMFKDTESKLFQIEVLRLRKDIESGKRALDILLESNFESILGDQ
jgi:anti-sigma28 factor (negative regulator of flagellin synthesis)